MSDENVLDERQREVAKALIEWRDAGGPVEEIVLTIQRMILYDMRKVFGSFGADHDDQG